MSAIASRVRGLLAQLGDDPRDVVKRLKREKIKGKRWPLEVSVYAKPAPSPSCPIANYLRVHGVDRPRVGRSHVHFVENKRAVKVPSTAAVAVFVTDFDEGDYPELEEKP